eukprot:scaffold149253_cov19-Tisochrysis_lutea.AAC.1
MLAAAAAAAAPCSRSQQGCALCLVQSLLLGGQLWAVQEQGQQQQAADASLGLLQRMRKVQPLRFPHAPPHVHQT